MIGAFLIGALFISVAARLLASTPETVVRAASLVAVNQKHGPPRRD
jgi:hypothetical protein